MSPLETELTNALDEALVLLAEWLGEDNATVNRLGDVLAKANRMSAFQHLETMGNAA